MPNARHDRPPTMRKILISARDRSIGASRSSSAGEGKPATDRFPIDGEERRRPDDGRMSEHGDVLEKENIRRTLATRFLSTWNLDGPRKHVLKAEFEVVFANVWVAGSASRNLLPAAQILGQR